MRLAMQRVRQDLQAINQARTWAAKILRAIRNIHSSRANRGQVLPASDGLQWRYIVHCSLDAAATTGDKHDLRLPSPHFVPAQRPTGPPFATKTLDTSRQPDQLGIPMAAGERWIEPLQ